MSGTNKNLGARWRRGFWSLWVVQFQGAFSDNAFKLLAIYLITNVYSSESDQDRLVPVVSALFALPFVLFSMAGGYLADRYSKRTVTMATKAAETPVMLIGSLALWQGNIPLMCVTVFLLSTQSAFFGPSKYGLVPELVPDEKLAWANGMISLGTFLASISGMIAAGLSADLLGKHPDLSPGWAGAALLCCALVGLTVSKGISRVPVANAQRVFRLNFVAELWTRLVEIRKSLLLFWIVILGTFFWFVASQFQALLVIFGEHDLGLSKTQNSMLLASLLLGIALGSCAAGYLSGDSIKTMLVPAGAGGLAVFTALLSIGGTSFGTAVALLIAVGFCGGVFIVPINALIQHLPPKESRGGVIATEAFLSWVAMLGSAGVFWVFKDLMGLSSAGVFLVLGLICAVVSGLAFKLVRHRVE